MPRPTDPLEGVRELNAGGVDHAFEVVGRPETMRLAWELLRPAATAVVVGLAPAGVEVSFPAIDFLSDKGIRGSYYGSGDPAADLPALAELALTGELDLPDVVTHVSRSRRRQRCSRAAPARRGSANGSRARRRARWSAGV